MNRLFWDIETSPNIVTAWRIGHKVTLLPGSIIKERAVICIGYKWEDDPETHLLTWNSKQEDQGMLARFARVAAQADELVRT